MLPQSPFPLLLSKVTQELCSSQPGVPTTCARPPTTLIRILTLLSLHRNLSTSQRKDFSGLKRENGSSDILIFFFQISFPRGFLGVCICSVTQLQKRVLLCSSSHSLWGLFRNQRMYKHRWRFIVHLEQKFSLREMGGRAQGYPKSFCIFNGKRCENAVGSSRCVPHHPESPGINIYHSLCVWKCPVAFSRIFWGE